MIRRMFWTSIFATLLVSVFSASLAYGLAISTSEAWIDWANLVITPDTGVTITWADKYSVSYVHAKSSTTEDEDLEEAMDWVDTDATADVTDPSGKAEGEAYTSDSRGLYEYSTARSDSGGQYEVYAFAGRVGVFEVSGSGNITITVPYSMSLKVSATRPDEVAWGYMACGIGAYGLVGTYVDEYDTVETSGYISGIGSFVDGYSDNFSIDFLVNDGDQIQFGAAANMHGTPDYLMVNSPIPEPSTLILFGVGFLSILGYAFRKKRRS